MIAFNAGGCRAASWRLEKPPHEYAGHADGAVAPGLRGDPGDRLDAVELLALRVLVLDDPVGIAGPSDVDAHARIAVAGEIPHLLVVADRGTVVLAVREVAEDGRHGTRRRRAARASLRAGSRRRAEPIRARATVTSNGKSVRTRTSATAAQSSPKHVAGQEADADGPSSMRAGAPYRCSTSGTATTPSSWKFSITASSARAVTAVPFSMCNGWMPCSPR